MKLDLFNQVAEIVDVLTHCSLRCLFEVVELLLKDAEFSIAPCAVLCDQLLPCVGSCFTPNNTGVRSAI